MRKWGNKKGNKLNYNIILISKKDNFNRIKIAVNEGKRCSKLFCLSQNSS